jgi:hypothetical protein
LSCPLWKYCSALGRRIKYLLSFCSVSIVDTDRSHTSPSWKEEAKSFTYLLWRQEVSSEMV